jgi:DNA-binding transcriptional MerR regulator
VTTRNTALEAPADDHAYLQIGEVAERTGVTQRTLRFYEEKGLLKPPSRLDGGFRLYSEGDVARVERIKELQSLLGLSLADIKEMVESDEVKLQLRASYRRDADVVERREKIAKAIEVTEHQASIIDHKLRALQEMRDALGVKVRKYRGWLGNVYGGAPARR